MTSSGKLFQTLAPAIGKARLPKVGRQKDGTSSLLDDADRRYGGNDVIAKYYLCSMLPPPCCWYTLCYVNMINNSSLSAVPAYFCAWN